MKVVYSYCLHLHKEVQEVKNWIELSEQEYETITIFGEELIQAFNKHKLMMFQNVLRKSK